MNGVGSSARQFGHFELQPSERLLLAKGAPVALGPRAFELLLALTERPRHLLSKDELLARVWPRVVVEENALQVQVSALRKLLGPEAIKTVSKSGYRFELDVVDVAASASSGNERHHLPYLTTSFIGRGAELQQLDELLPRTRLLTLTGSGGCGKTRLVVEFVGRLRGGYPDGMWFVELAPLADPHAVPRALAAAVGCPEEAGKPTIESLLGHWAERKGLIVLDNAEHVVDAVAMLVGRLLEGCHHLVVLVTSRERLNVAGEQVYRVGPLSVPAIDRPQATMAELAENESIRLFLDRARLLRPHFNLTLDNRVAVASVCRRLEGIPLAIELAAPRLRSMTIDEIDDRLDRRFALLTGGIRTAQGRQRTLRALVDWSYDLLTESEQALLRRASVFTGGWTLEGAEQVCTARADQRTQTLDLLVSLTDKSLLLADETEGGTRYRMLESVRQYASERLEESGESPAYRARHCERFLAVAEITAPHLMAGNPRGWLDRIEADHDNFRAALAWCASGGDVLLSARIAVALWRFWYKRGYLEEGWLYLHPVANSCLSLPDTELTADLFYAAGSIAGNCGQTGDSARYHHRALEICRTLGMEERIAMNLTNLGTLAMKANEPVASRRYHEEALSIHRRTGSKSGMSAALNNLGTAAHAVGDFLAARLSHEEALVIRREVDDRWGIATSLLNLASLTRDAGAFTEARRFVAESLAIYRDVGEPRGIAYALGISGLICNDDGKTRAGHVLLMESLDILQRVGDPEGVLEVLFGLAHAVGAGEPERAARIWGAIEQRRQALGIVSTPSNAVSDQQHIAAVRKLAPPEAFEQSWIAGRTMDFEAALTLAAAPPFDAS